MREDRYQPLPRSLALPVPHQETPSSPRWRWLPARFSKLSGYKLALTAAVLLVCVVFFLLTNLMPVLWKSASRCLNPYLEDEASLNETLRLKMHYSHTRRMLPHCIIIGARKAGTRALLQFLKLHPSVQVAAHEIHFFDRDWNYQQGLAWYRKHMPFAFKDQIVVEKTPAYFVSAVAPERIHQMNSSVRLLLIVRDPVKRAISDYTQIRDVKRQRGKQMPPFEQLAVEAGTGLVNVSYVAIWRSLYHRHMLKWLQFFPLEQIHIVDGSRLSTAPWEEMQKVEEFLGLEHAITRKNFTFNETRGFYCILSRTGTNGCLASSKGRTHPKTRQEVIDKLRDFFRPYNEKFFQLVKRRFDWNGP